MLNIAVLMPNLLSVFAKVGSNGSFNMNYCCYFQLIALFLTLHNVVAMSGHIIDLFLAE